MHARIVHRDGAAESLYYLDGKEVSREEFFASFPAQEVESDTGKPGAPSSLISFKPLHSEALAVHPRQIKEATEDAVRKGVPTEFDPEGRPIFTSSRHFRRYAKRYGFFHRGY
jgi:hypothetical protein